MAVDTYTASGTHTWTCPAGVTSVQVECWGGGGGNSSSATGGRGGGGGGGGAYSKSNAIAVTPGVGYTVTVGAGRAGNQNGGTAGSSSFVGDAAATCLAVGGVNGNNNSGGAGGQAASCTGDTKYSGGNGGSAGIKKRGGSGGGSSAGNASNGNNGASSSGTVGGTGGAAPTGGAAGGKGGTHTTNAGIQPGFAPGGGAGGRCAAAASAQAGADGQVILTYTASSNSTITANQGSFTLTGQSVTLTAARKITAAQGSDTLTGQSANLLVGYKLAASTGSITLSGQSVNFNLTRKITADKGDFTLSGQDVTLTAARKLSADSTSFTLTGQDSSLEIGRKVSADSASFALSGQSVNFGVTRKITADKGDFSLSGQDVTLTSARKLSADSTSFSLSGQDASLNIGHKLSADSASFSLSGQDASLEIGYKLSADSTSFTLSGQDATLTKAGEAVSYTLTANHGTFSLSGQNASLLANRVLVAESVEEGDADGFVVEGFDVEFSKGLNRPATNDSVHTNWVTLDCDCPCPDDGIPADEYATCGGGKVVIPGSFIVRWDNLHAECTINNPTVVCGGVPLSGIEDTKEYRLVRFGTGFDGLPCASPPECGAAYRYGTLLPSEVLAIYGIPWGPTCGFGGSTTGLCYDGGYYRYVGSSTYCLQFEDTIPDPPHLYYHRYHIYLRLDACFASGGPDVGTDSVLQLQQSQIIINDSKGNYEDDGITWNPTRVLYGAVQTYQMASLPIALPCGCVGGPGWGAISCPTGGPVGSSIYQVMLDNISLSGTSTDYMDCCAAAGSVTLTITKG